MLFTFLAIFGTIGGTKLANKKEINAFTVFHKETTKFDFKSIQELSKPFEYVDTRNTNMTYIVRFAKELTKDDLPSYANWNLISAHKGTNAVRCDVSLRRCDPLSTIYEYDWTTILDSMPELGVLSIADGEPFLNSKGDYEEYEIHFEFRCNKSSTTIDEPQMFIDKPYREMPRLYLLFRNQLSCGEPFAVQPTNTPQPFNPDCTVYYRQDQNSSLAIYFNLTEWNGGALGLPAKFNVGNEVKYIFWSPCERMVNCPWGASCGAAKMSSAWICDEDIKTCENFTIIPGTENISYVDTNLINDSDINQGFQIVYDSVPGATLRVNITCNSNYPNDHVLFHGTGDYNSATNTYTLYGEALDACPSDVPEPHPPIDKCRFNLTQGNYFIDMDLATFKHESGTVTVSGDLTSQYDLYYAPCDSMPCPDGYDCDGDEDISVLLCEKNVVGRTPTCTAYGILDHGMYASLKSDYIINGVTVYYEGDRARKSEIDFKCDKSTLGHNLKLPEKVHLRDGKLTVDVSTIDACMTGTGPTPTPPPIVRPTIPEVVKPTPTPVPSPRSVYFFEDETKNEYVIIDLPKLQSKTYEGYMELYVRGKKGTIYTEFHPWNLLPYPDSWGSNKDFDQANFWQCWFDESFKPYCHPVGDKRVPGLNVSLQKEGNIDSGVRITYEGAYGVNLDIDISCDQSADHKLDLGNLPVVYTQSTNNDKWSIDTALELACSNKFQPASTPYPSNTPQPHDVKIVTKFSTTVGGKSLSLNLNNVKETAAKIALGYSNYYSKAELRFHPTKKLGCPAGRTCPSEYQEGNVWLCINTTETTEPYGFCYPTGNMDYGLNILAVSKTDPYAGLTVNYDGGLYGSETHFNFFCKEDLPADEIEFEQVGILNPPGKVPVIHVLSSQVCPNGSGRSTTGGAYFLIVLAVVFIAYFGIGTLIMYVWMGSITIPNENFWTEFFQCVTTAVVFIFTCGRSRTAAAYDNI
ncbi:hypothetical protein TRFO_00819 [Tritrichomonas foetus]|uniref:MRH domain-containing protein n=1 Tax=Tritrichomonas foetus TaxID=1144522 RepID=A0A1J4L6K3_9EUKA|nr:hypothetical protein TRFO_00819 [Tritrichomonas foetus]|eukprot:OHT17573.1 hypothetical protein TRFO_00819 [Tritrichomonas foetus]